MPNPLQTLALALPLAALLAACDQANAPGQSGSTAPPAASDGTSVGKPNVTPGTLGDPDNDGNPGVRPPAAEPPTGGPSSPSTD